MYNKKKNGIKLFNKKVEKSTNLLKDFVVLLDLSKLVYTHFNSDFFYFEYRLLLKLFSFDSCSIVQNVKN